MSDNIDNYEQYIESIQQNEGWVRILQSFARFVDPSADSLLIDIGSGAGAFSQIMHQEFGVKAINVDYSHDLLMAAHYQFSDSVNLQASVFSLPFAQQSVDIVTATNVIYLLEQPINAMKEIQRILAPNGVFAMLNPSPNMSIEAATELADKRNLHGEARQHLLNWAAIAEENVRWSAEDIQQMVKEAGLTVIETRERIGNGLALYVKLTHKL